MSDERIIDGVDYGPLSVLVGEWRGEQGTDVAPRPERTATQFTSSRIVVTRRSVYGRLRILVR